MLELFFFLFFIPKQVRKAAIPRGESTIKWTLLCWLSWLAIEFLAIVLGLLFLVATRTFLSWPNQDIATAIGVIIYMVGLAGGMTAADRVRWRLEQLPIRVVADSG